MKFKDVRPTLRAFFLQAFVPREIFFRGGGRFRHLRVSPRVQAFGAAFVMVGLGFGLFLTSGFITQHGLLVFKNHEIERQRLSYMDLLTEVTEFQDQFAKITDDLEDNQDYLLSVLERGPNPGRNLEAIRRRLKTSETEHARVLIARDALRERMQDSRGILEAIAERNQSLGSEVAQIMDLVESSEAARDQLAAAREQVVRRLAQVESELDTTSSAKNELAAKAAELRRDLEKTEAARERLLAVKSELNSLVAGLKQQLETAGLGQAELRDQVAALDLSLTRALVDSSQVAKQREDFRVRVGNLEQRLVNLRDAEQSVIERLSGQTELGIQDIERTVEMAGLDLEALLARRRGEVLGQGGPFVPMTTDETELGPTFQLEASVSILDQQLLRWSELRDVLRTLPLSAPLDQYRISSSFGKRKDPVNGRKAKHQGTDFAAPSRTPVYATAPGKVVFVGWRGRYGRMIEIDHGHGIRTRYGHLRKILVKVGQKVENRAKIGLVGSSGRSTGPHVHYEIRFRGRAKNPRLFLKAGKHVFKS